MGEYINKMLRNNCFQIMLDVVREVGDGVLVRAIAVIGRRGVSIAGVRDPRVSNSCVSVC